MIDDDEAVRQFELKIDAPAYDLMPFGRMDGPFPQTTFFPEAAGDESL